MLAKISISWEIFCVSKFSLTANYTNLYQKIQFIGKVEKLESTAKNTSNLRFQLEYAATRHYRARHGHVRIFGSRPDKNYTARLGWYVICTRAGQKQIAICSGDKDIAKLYESIPKNTIYWKGRKIRITIIAINIKIIAGAITANIHK